MTEYGNRCRTRLRFPSSSAPLVSGTSAIRSIVSNTSTRNASAINALRSRYQRQGAKSSLGLIPGLGPRRTGAQLALAQGNLVSPSLRDDGFVLTVEAVKQRKHHRRPFVGRKGKRFVNQVVYTGIHWAKS